MPSPESPHSREFEFEKPEHAEPVSVVSTALALYNKGPYTGLLLTLVLDTSKQPDLKQLIRLHALSQTGDYSYQWAQFLGDKKETWRLIVTFTGPERTVAILTFNVRTAGRLITKATQESGYSLYPGFRLYPGRPGDNVAKCDSEERESIIVDLNVAQEIVELQLTLGAK